MYMGVCACNRQNIMKQSDGLHYSNRAPPKSWLITYLWWKSNFIPKVEYSRLQNNLWVLTKIEFFVLLHSTSWKPTHKTNLLHLVNLPRFPHHNLRPVVYLNNKEYYIIVSTSMEKPVLQITAILKYFISSIVHF